MITIEDIDQSSHGDTHVLHVGEIIIYIKPYYDSWYHEVCGYATRCYLDGELIRVSFSPKRCGIESCIDLAVHWLMGDMNNA